MGPRKGILLAGGSGTRLYPVTRAVSKQLVPVFDKPLVYYPLCTLMLSGVREILVITRPADAAAFVALLGDGSQWGLSLHYAVQDEPRGIADAFLVGRRFLGESPVSLVLGDNIFVASGLAARLQRVGGATSGATIFAYNVRNPERYGVVELTSGGSPVSIEEKPAVPRSTLAVTGIYFYDDTVRERAAALRPSPRGELEITDLNRSYLADGQLSVEILGRGSAWLDAGTHEALLQAANYIQMLEERQGMKVSCPEEVAWRMGFIDDAALVRLSEPLVASGYGGYLLSLLTDGR